MITEHAIGDGTDDLGAGRCYAWRTAPGGTTVCVRWWFATWLGIEAHWDPHVMVFHNVTKSVAQFMYEGWYVENVRPAKFGV
ncbi:hypothetical protein JOD54_002166 [Actinokineospora baliensis]|uniref:hypothetical protein n=1 Tax=Actinokineospora baliensis TaxID=547056 RepID=UPI00195E2536|nr:hypothetical protein [Actinokineospora baliensis]MBM7771962.1 hypothetical protein [Actinokineospora baliensis]